MTTTQKITAGALVATGAVLLYAETRALEDAREGDTISEFVWQANKHTPLLALACGIVMGHFFWQREASTVGSK